MTYIDTPRTDAGNATYMTNGHNFENFSIENSFVSPSKPKDDLILQLRNGRGLNLRTPQTRAPLADRRNVPASAAQGEFTPLLKSATKKNLSQSRGANRVPQTPGLLRYSVQGDSPGLPAVEESVTSVDDSRNSIGREDVGTPMPQMASSSVQSTPLAVLPQRDASGVLADQGNLLTLKEQENLVSKVEKENFGLKLKIHYMEETLRKAAPGFHEAAIKENTDLKVNRATLYEELRRTRKILQRAERDVEAYRIHLLEAQEKTKRKHADEGLSDKLQILREEVTSKDAEIAALHGNLRSNEERNGDMQKLQDDVEDLEAELREKRRVIEDRDDEIDQLRAQAAKDSEEMDGLDSELEKANKRIVELDDNREGAKENAEELKETRDQLAEVRQALQILEERAHRAEDDAKSAREVAKTSLAAQQQAEADIDELRDEMANKSINTKGLSRQVEEKANKLQSELADLRQTHANLQERFDDRSREAKKLQEQVHGAKQDAEDQAQRLKDENEILQHEREVTNRKCESLSKQLQESLRELQNRAEEKDLLHSRHDALTEESQVLRKDLGRVQTSVKELERNLENEKQHALKNDRSLRSQAKEEMDRLSEEIDSLRRELEDKESGFAAEHDMWEGQRRGLLSQKDKAEEKAAGLQRTVNKLQQSEGTLSGQEVKLQEALESEKQRHQSEEAVLSRQIQEANAEIDDRRRNLDDVRSQLSRTKEELRVCKRDQDAVAEKAQALEDEVEVLQLGLDEETEKSKQDVSAARQEAEGLRRQLHASKQELARAQSLHADARAEIETFQEDLNAGVGTKQQLNLRLSEVEGQLQRVKAEKQFTQDQLANVNIELQHLRTTSAETADERDEVKSQLKQMQDQVDETFRLDQEKLDLRTAKLKLEHDVARLREERKGLRDASEAIERELEEEIAKASTEECRLGNEIADLKRKLAAASEGRSRELSAAKQKIAALERQLQDVESRNILDSPKSSVGGSARKNELLEVRRQLAESHQKLSDLRSKFKEAEREAKRALAASAHEAYLKFEADGQHREQLEQQLVDTRLLQEESEAKNARDEQTISRLRTRISSLEKDLQAARANMNGDRTMAEERKDLHEMLKDAKLEVEDLQLQIADREARIDSSSVREKDLRSQLKRVRDERTLQLQKCTALTAELEGLQNKYERCVDNLARQQRVWDEEKKAIVSRVRFPNTSVSSVHAGDSTELRQLEEDAKNKERKHQGELRGLAKQIQWLRARCTREEGFRAGLAFEKRFLLMQIEMFSACNAEDLHMLEKMGVTPDKSIREKKPTLRTVGIMVLAGLRMRRLQTEWAGQKKIQASLARKVEQMRKESGKTRAH